jgi:glycosyltransferase involved in cell wall biosynthesis
MWFSCQLGAREHYAVPRALQLGGLLREFITDLWIRPNVLTRRWRNKLSGRFHPELAHACVNAANAAALSFQVESQIRGLGGWQLTVRRNDWFQRNVLARLKHRERELDRRPATVFAYSYAAEQIFNYARERGWRTVLGQIDPGPAEESIVSRLLATGSGNAWQPAPAEYWRKWRNECELADQILVNSAWSRKALLREGIPETKIRVIPLAFEPRKQAQGFERTYPSVFTAVRPLKVLFLGQVNLRKGAEALLEAARLLGNEAVEFWFVGPRQIQLASQLDSRHNVKFFGAVPRMEVDRFYRDADVFILPTLSDGFGLTQLEAQSWKLPVIASRFCGEVVEHGHNGLILAEVSGEEIAKVLTELLGAPHRLPVMSRQSYVRGDFSLQSLASSLSQL